MNEELKKIETLMKMFNTFSAEEIESLHRIGIMIRIDKAEKAEKAEKESKQNEGHGTTNKTRP